MVPGYSNITDYKYPDVTYTKTSWEYNTISFLNSSFQRILKTSKIVPKIIGLYQI